MTKADISAIFGLGASGGSDIAMHKDRYIGEAVEAEYLRKTEPDRPVEHLHRYLGLFSGGR